MLLLVDLFVSRDRAAFQERLGGGNRVAQQSVNAASEIRFEPTHFFLIPQRKRILIPGAQLIRARTKGQAVHVT